MHKEEPLIPLVFGRSYFENHCFVLKLHMDCHVSTWKYNITQYQSCLPPVLSEKNGKVDLNLSHMEA